MRFYTFNSDFELIDLLEDAGFTGFLFVYHPTSPDYFTQIARDVDLHKKIKYMVAVRPYVVSPEHLVSLSKTITKISERDSIQINLVSGHIKPDEKNLIRTIGNVNNRSSQKERLEYLIKYVDMLNTLPIEDKPDYYVSTTNDLVFNAVSSYDDKMIIDYKDYTDKRFNIKNLNKVMITFGPIIRNTKEELDNIYKDSSVSRGINNLYFTEDQLADFVKKLETEGIQEIMFWHFSKEELTNIINFVKKYNEERQ